MLKLISLFFIVVFMVSCGGEVGVIYHNGANSSGNTNGSGNSNGSNGGIKPNTSQITCLPGADCNIKQPSTNTQTSNNCLPGVECTPSNIKIDIGTKPTTSDTNKSKTNCLPGQSC